VTDAAREQAAAVIEDGSELERAVVSGRERDARSMLVD